MTTPWHKVLRDFWQERTRTVLVVLAIAMGIAGFSTVLSTYAILTRELDKGYLATNPASATLYTDAIDDALLGKVRANRDLSDAEPRRALRGRIKAGPAEWRNLTLFVVKDYADIRVSTLNREKGAWPPGRGEILIERDAFQVAHAHIGDSVRVKTTDGEEQMLRVTGSVHDVGQAQARMENTVYGYITLDTLAQLGEEPYLDQLKILVRENRFDEDHVRRVASGVKALVERENHPVRRMEVPKPGKHPHADIMGLLLLSMSTFGLFILLLSGILVVNLLMALMASQVRQIGMMKAVGGTRSQIARIYLGQAVLLGLFAFVIAVPLGMWGCRVLCRYMALFLNFDITSFAVPLWVYLLAAATGIVVPLLAAAYPVWKGSGVSVREALADYGVAAASFGSKPTDRLVARIGGRARPILLAMRNSFRRRTRLVLTVLTLAAGGMFFMSALNVRASLIHTLDRLFGARKYDLSVGLGTMHEWESVQRAVRKTPGVVAAEGWITSEGVISKHETRNTKHETRSHAAESVPGDRFSVVALPSRSKLMQMDIIRGRGFRPGETNGIIVNNNLATRRREMKVGNTVSFQMGPAMTRWTVVGVVREPFSPSLAYIPLEFFDGLHPGQINSVRLVLDKTDPQSIRRVEAALDENLEKEGIRARSSASKAETRYGFDQHMVMIYVFLIITSLIIAGVGGLGLMTTMSVNVLERRREMGVLRAIGASPRAIWLIVVAEAVAIGVLSCLLAVLVAWPASKAIGNFMVTLMFQSPLDFSFEKAGIGIWLVLSIALAVVASFVPAWHASRGSIREALTYE